MFAWLLEIMNVLVHALYLIENVFWLLLCFNYSLSYNISILCQIQPVFWANGTFHIRAIKLISTRSIWQLAYHAQKCAFTPHWVGEKIAVCDRASKGAHIHRPESGRQNAAKVNLKVKRSESIMLCLKNHYSAYQTHESLVKIPSLRYF